MPRLQICYCDEPFDSWNHHSSSRILIYFEKWRNRRVKVRELMIIIISSLGTQLVFLTCIIASKSGKNSTHLYNYGSFQPLDAQWPDYPRFINVAELSGNHIYFHICRLKFEFFFGIFQACNNCCTTSNSNYINSRKQICISEFGNRIFFSKLTSSC